MIQVIATDSDVSKPYNQVVYDTSGTSEAERFFDVDVTSGDIYVKRDLRYPTTKTSEVFVLRVKVRVY